MRFWWSLLSPREAALLIALLGAHGHAPRDQWSVEMGAQLHAMVADFDPPSAAAVLWGFARMAAAGGRRPGAKFTADFAARAAAGIQSAGAGPLARGLWGLAALGHPLEPGFLPAWEARAAALGWDAFSADALSEVAQAYDRLPGPPPGPPGLAAALAARRAAAEAEAAAAAARAAAVEDARRDARRKELKRAAFAERKRRVAEHRAAYAERRAAKLAAAAAAAAASAAADAGGGAPGDDAAAAAAEAEAEAADARHLRAQRRRNRQYGYNKFVRKYGGGFGGRAAAERLGNIVVEPPGGGGGGGGGADAPAAAAEGGGGGGGIGAA
jgi:hypothetical protein